MDISEVEQLAALAKNWREAEESNDHAASEAFEDELHARVSEDEMMNLKLTDPQMGEVSSTKRDWLQSALERMWSNASARLG